MEALEGLRFGMTPRHLVLCFVLLQMFLCAPVFSVLDFGYENLTEEDGYFIFPGTRLNGTYVWNISVANGYSVQMGFENLYLDCYSFPYYACTCYLLQIYDGVEYNSDNLLFSSACNNWYNSYWDPWPGLTTSFSNNMLIILTGYSSDLYIGAFSGFYESVLAEGVIRNCGGHIYNTEGTITSPGFPNGYQNMMVCEWLVTVDPDYRIVLNYLETDMEYSGNCKYDSLQIRDGNIYSSPLRTFVCGSNFWNHNFLTSLKNHLHIKFVSDWMATRRGFKVNWTVESCERGNYTAEPTTFPVHVDK